MSNVSVSGTGNISQQASFYIVNRVDKATLKVIDKLLGGPDRVAYMVEEVLLPNPELMALIEAPGRRVLRFNFRKANSRDLREQLLELQQAGYHVVFIPGRPEQLLGCVSDVPMPFMMQLAALHVAPIPVYVGFYRNDVLRTYTTLPDDYDWAVVRVMPKVPSAPLTGDRVLEAWMEASAEAYDTHPLLKKSLARLLVEGIRKHPNTELIDGLDNTRLPYYKMLGVAMALARHLKATVKEPRLGILLPPGKGGMIANYACLLAGIVPVNINYTSAEAAFQSIINQSGIQHFITARAFMTKLPQFPWPSDEKIIHLDKTLKGIGMPKIAAWVTFARFAPMTAVAMTFGLDKRKEDDEAALLFTSGSSGEPKGVSLTHKMIVANVTQMLSKAELDPGSAFLCSLPIFHSFGLTVSTFLPPVYGFTMVTYPSPLEAKKLNELIERYECRLVVTTPTFARSMVRRAHPHAYDKVKYFIVGAEKLQQSVADEFMEKCGVRLLEGYGLTETTPVCGTNLAVVQGSERQPYYVPGYKFGSIGHLFPGMAVRITDPDDDSVRLPLSEQGMIWFKGPNVFHGYVGRPELNESIFRDGWFKTGDLGSVDLNGFLSLGGRRSRFSKIGGEMVPHEVVEQAIEAFVQCSLGASSDGDEEQHARAVTIVGVPDAQKGEALVLLSRVHQSNLKQALDDIRAHMAEVGLPRLWVPREIIPVEAIPMLPSGKLDLRGCRMLACESLGLPLN